MHGQPENTPERRFTVYGLVDPRDGSIRYVGRTGLPPETRLAGHLSSLGSQNTGGSKKKRAWLRELIEAGLKPGIRVLEDFAGELEAVDAEGRWIAKGLAEGWPLTNGHKSGRGTISKETRNAIREKQDAEKKRAQQRFDRWERRQPKTYKIVFNPIDRRRLERFAKLKKLSEDDALQAWIDAADNAFQRVLDEAEAERAAKRAARATPFQEAA
jgi:hypothetical protein